MSIFRRFRRVFSIESCGARDSHFRTSMAQLERASLECLCTMWNDLISTSANRLDLKYKRNDDVVFYALFGLSYPISQCSLKI